MWFPRLASDASLRDRPVEGPFALVLRRGGADRLHCLNPAASAGGLARDMTLADARAVCPGLITRPANLAREAAALASLRRWAGRYAPLVATDGPDGLIADITGVPHLFGGERELRDDLHARLSRAGLHVGSAIAGTRGAAHALARHGGGIIADGRLAEAIGPLPVAALRIDPGTTRALVSLELERIADLAALPRASLARRFGPELVMRLDQTLGLSCEPVAAVTEPPHFSVRMTFAEPIGLQSDVMAGLGRLLERLCQRLASAQRGARHLTLALQRVNHTSAQVEIGLARPGRDPDRIAALFVTGIGEIDAGFGIESMRLSASLTEPLVPEQITGAQIAAPQTPAPGGPGPGGTGEELADLLSSLGNRIGFDRVQRLLPAESLIPERSFLLASAAWSAPQSALPPCPGPARPCILFPPEPVTTLMQGTGRPPARFRWRRMELTTLRAAGPERITPEWWFDDPAWRSGLRDYWRIETCEGPRLWLFHTPQQAGRWSVQGEFP